MKEDPVYLRERRVWAVETPVLLLRELEREESVGRKSEDENCGSELGVRAGYLDSGGSIFGGCGRTCVSPYLMIEIQVLALPLGGEFAFFVSRHEQR